MKARRVRGEEVGGGGEDSTLMSLMEATCAALLTVHPLPLLSSTVRGVWYRLNVSSWTDGEDTVRK